MNCLTCRHNMYAGTRITDHFDCVHPVTLERNIRVQKGDPAIVDFRTSDIPVSRVSELGECPTYESQQ